jgi:hypothetical protein
MRQPQSAHHNNSAQIAPPSIVVMNLSLALAAVAASATLSSAFIQNAAFARRSSTALNVDRQPIMAGNWKMNPGTEEEALDLASSLTKLLGEETCPMDEDNEFCTEVVIFPPHPFIAKVKDVVDDIGITVGAQSIFFEDKGAYTGSVAASMVKSIGCQYILCGHSERRTLFNDSDDAINRKVRKVLEVCESGPELVPLRLLTCLVGHFLLRLTRRFICFFIFDSVRLE